TKGLGKVIHVGREHKRCAGRELRRYPLVPGKALGAYCVLAGWPVVPRKKGACSLKMISPSRPGNTSPPMICSASAPGMETSPVSRGKVAGKARKTVNGPKRTPNGTASAGNGRPKNCHTR